MCILCLSVDMAAIDRLGVLTNDADELYEQKRFAEAARAYQRVVDAGGGDARVFENLGNCLYASWRLKEAGAAYNAAIRCDPQSARLYSSLGESLYDRRRFRNAIESYRKAAALSLAEAKQHLPTHEISVEEEQKALAKCPKAQEAMEEYADRCIDLGYSYFCLREFDEAIAQLKLAISKAPYYPLAYHALASVYWTQGSYTEAKREWKKAKDRYHNCEAQMIQRGWAGWLIYYGTLLHEVFRELDEAERIYKSALEVGTRPTKSWIGLTALYLERQENDPKRRNQAGCDAQKAYRKAKSFIETKEIEDVESMLTAGELALSMMEYDAAEGYFKMAVAEDEKQRNDPAYVSTAKPHTDLGIFCMRKKQYKNAITHFQSALTIDANDLALRSNFAEACLRDEQFDEAEKEFLKVLAIAPDHIESRIGLGAVYTAWGDTGDADMYDNAISEYSRALALAKKKIGSKRLKPSESAKLHYSRGYARVKSYESSGTVRDQGRVRDARADFRECCKLDPDHYKARRACEKIGKMLPHRSPQRYIEDWGPSVILVFSLGVFLLTQFFLIWSFIDKSRAPRWLSFLDQSQHIPLNQYVALTMGSLMLMVASCYLPQLLKLKVPGIELEKTAVDQITTLGPIGISRPT